MFKPLTGAAGEGGWGAITGSSSSGVTGGTGRVFVTKGEAGGISMGTDRGSGAVGLPHAFALVTAEGSPLSNAGSVRAGVGRASGTGSG